VSELLEYRIDVSNSTPLLIGWHDPLKIDPKGIRTTEIKGLWRWWARAFVAGAMYDLDLLKGEHNREDVLAKPSKEDVEAISCFVGKIMGLGYTGSLDAEGSRFILYSEPLQNIRIRNLKDEFQRIRLLSIKRSVETLEPGGGFRVIVRKRVERYRDAENTALRILIVSLQLSGLGKGGRRGLGSLDIRSRIDVVREGSLKGLVENVYRETIEIIRKYADLCIKRSFVEKREDLIPPMPLVSKGSYKNLKIFQILSVRNVSFRSLHNFFVRSERCRVLYGNLKCEDDLRKTLNAWILGLPREQKSTGYSIRSETIVRRASPILLSYHARGNIFGEGGFISVFISGDWPLRLEWCEGSSGCKEINIDPTRLVNAYSIAIKELNDYLSKLNANITYIWP
jgi:CRISPR-associated protein Cmr1